MPSKEEFNFQNRYFRNVLTDFAYSFGKYIQTNLADRLKQIYTDLATHLDKYITINLAEDLDK